MYSRHRQPPDLILWFLAYDPGFISRKLELECNAGRSPFSPWYLSCLHDRDRDGWPSIYCHFEIRLDPGIKISYLPLKKNSSETVYFEQMPTRHYYHPPNRFAKCWYPPTSSLYTTVRPDLGEMNPKKNKRLLVPINTIMKLYIHDSECNSYRDHRLKVQSTATTV